MIELVLPELKHKIKYEEMMDEWEVFDGRLHPGALRRTNATYEKWLKWMSDDSKEETCPKGSPPQTMYFLMNNDKLVGATTIRHRYNEKTFIDGGCIGGGIRPSERNKGYGTILLKLALEKCKQYFTEKALITCDEDNIGSTKTIINNGGIFEGVFEKDNGKRISRYWMKFK